MDMFRSVIFLHSFYIVASYLGRALCHGPTFEKPLEKSETDLKGIPIFLEIIMLLGQKIDKTETDSK